jgi:hypothetical protein
VGFIRSYPVGYRGVSVVGEPRPTNPGILLFIWTKNEDYLGKELMDDEKILRRMKLGLYGASKAVICALQRYHDQTIEIFERPLLDD